MKTGVRLAILLFAALLLAGCSDRAPPSLEPEPSTSAPSSSASSTSASNSPVLPSVLTDSLLRWNDCFSMGGLFTEPAAAAPTNSEVPPGWEQPVDTHSSYQLKVFRCGRVSIGPYERPVTGMTELHNKITVPPQCVEFKPDITGIYVMVALWLDDQEVADYLHATYGIPVRVAQFNYIDNATHRRWTWSTGDSPTSEIGMPFVADDSFESLDVTRMIWHNGTAVSMWDSTDVQRNENFVYLLTVYGVLREPMLHARIDGEPVVGRGESSTGEKTQAIYRFGDLECKEPL